MRLRRFASVFAITAAVAAAVLLLIAGRDHPARAGVPFEPDLGFNISNTAGDSYSPAGAFDPSGNGIVGWIDTTPGSPTIFGSYTNNGGGGWHPITDVSQGSDSVQAPAVAAGGATFVYVWIGDSDIVARSSTNAGQTWNPPVTLGPIDGNAPPLVQISPANPNDIYVAWSDSSAAGGTTYLARSTNGGVNFGAPEEIADAFAGIMPSLAVTSEGKAHVSVVTQPEIQIFEWAPNQANPVIDTTIPYGARNASLFPAEGIVPGGVVLTFDTRAIPTAVLAANKAEGAWTGPVQLSNPNFGARNIAFWAHGLYAAAVWEEGTAAATNIQGAVSKDGGATFGEPFPVSTPGVAATDPGVGLVTDTLFAWYFQDPTGPTPTPPGTANPEQKIVAAKVPQGDDNPIVHYELDLVDEDPVLFMLRIFFSGGLQVGRSSSPSVPLTHPAAALVSEHLQDDTLTRDIVLTIVSVAGDPNCSGVADLGDAISLLDYLGELSVPACLSAGNVDCSSGTPDVTDLLILLKYLGGLPYTVPPECMPINLDVPHT